MYGFFHLCNHSVKYTEQAMEDVEITLENNRQTIQIISPGIIVTRIKEVYALEQHPFPTKLSMDYDTQIDYDKSEEHLRHYDTHPEDYFDYTMYIGDEIPLPKELYEKYLHNRIQWSVVPPKAYKVVVDIIVKNDFVTSVEQRKCRRCQSKGWFVDIVENDKNFIIARGEYKVLQQLVKDILTEVTTNRFDTEYGTRLHLMPQEHLDNELFKEKVRMAIVTVENNYLLRQNEIINTLPPDEILVFLEVLDVIIKSNDETNVSIILRIVTEQEDKIFQLKI